MPADASRCSSSTSSSSRAPYSPTCRFGATMKWPDEYGYLFSSAIVFPPRRTTRRCSSSPATASQKTQPGSSSADLMYSRRQGAHSCFTSPSLERVTDRLDRPRLRREPLAEGRQEEQRSDHGHDHQEGRGEKDRLKSEHVCSVERVTQDFGYAVRTPSGLFRSQVARPRPGRSHVRWDGPRLRP